MMMRSDDDDAGGGGVVVVVVVVVVALAAVAVAVAVLVVHHVLLLMMCLACLMVQATHTCVYIYIQHIHIYIRILDRWLNIPVVSLTSLKCSRHGQHLSCSSFVPALKVWLRPATRCDLHPPATKWISTNILLVKEVLHQLRCSFSHYLNKGFYTSEVVVWDFWTINSMIMKLILSDAQDFGYPFRSFR